MTIRATDLPAHARARLPQPPPRRKRPAEARDETVRWAHFRCATCGATNRYKAAAERHADETGHRRIECVLFPGAAAAGGGGRDAERAAGGAGRRWRMRAVAAVLLAATACAADAPAAPPPAPTTAAPPATDPVPSTVPATAPTPAAPSVPPTARAGRGAPRTTVAPATTAAPEGNEGAAAQDDAFWRRLADCECASGQCGGPYVSYFQFSRDTAAKVGIDGSEPYEEQRAAAQEWARRIHPREGTSAGWPHCWWKAAA